MAIKKKAKKLPVSKVKSIVKKKAIKVVVKSKSVAKKSAKAAPSSKAKKAIKKKPVVAVKKKAAGKRIVIGKKVVVKKKVVVRIKASEKKATVKPKGKKVVAKGYKKPLTHVVKNLPLSTFLPHGADLHLIPVTGEIHPARMDDTQQLEKNYKHTEGTALHMEQQKAKQIMAMTRNGGGKRIFKNRGQR